MTKATELSAAVKSRLELITPANGYSTNLRGVFDLKAPKDTQQTPFALLRWAEDRTVKKGLRDALRSRDYVVQGVFGLSATLADIERFHYDVLRALGWGNAEFDRSIPGQILSDSAEIEEAADGSQYHVITITLEAQYAEPYA